MNPPKKLTTQLRERDQRIAELETQLRQREAQLAQLEQQLAGLQERLAELERAGKRQATPFARAKHVAQRKRPGRKAGQGRFVSRARPLPEQITATKEVTLSGCPNCGGPLEECQTHEQFVIDLPEAPPTVTRYVTHSGRCAQCQQRVRTRHPEQISQATGAAGVVIGPRAKALVADWKHRLGVSYANIEEMLEVAFQLPFTRSGMCQADHRLALRQARPIYEELVALIRESAHVHVDETGWRIGVLAAWLWVFTQQHITVYTIQTSRGHEVVLDILGREFRGTLVSDCFTAYDHQALAAWLKQKCLGHLLKDLKTMRETKTRGAVRFAQDVTALLRDALALRDQQATLAPPAFQTRAAELEARLDRLIDPHRCLTDPDNQRFAKRLRKHREHLFRFLYVDGLDPTNNQAERMLRPAVITRKTTGCNRTDLGALTHAILASILVTCRQQNLPILDALVKIQRAAQADIRLLGLPQLPAP